MGIEIQIDRILDELEEAVDTFLKYEEGRAWGHAKGLQKALDILEDEMNPMQKELFDVLCEELEEA